MTLQADKLHDCIILGGGPAGVSMGHQLTRFPDIEYVILERGQIGHSWACMHDSLVVLSPMWVNQLPGFRFPLGRSFDRLPKKDFIQYLVSYAEHYSMNWVSNIDVTGVRKEDGLFLVTTSNGEIRSKTIVNATGYYSTPYTPELEWTDSSVPIMHSAAYKSPAELAKLLGPGNRKILIVGKRLSAGQLLEELDAAGYSLGISTRAEIETRAGGILGFIKETLYYLKEIFLLYMNPYIKQYSYAIMDGGKTDDLIKSGRLRHHTIVRGIKNGEVFFSNDEHDAYDLIICATGFKAEFPHLGRLIDDQVPLLEQLDKGEHLEVPGLFFLGIDNMINFTSRYVRGVAADSTVVSEKLIRHLRETGSV